MCETVTGEMKVMQTVLMCTDFNHHIFWVHKKSPFCTILYMNTTKTFITNDLAINNFGYALYNMLYTVHKE